jgi:hypothetical protein
MENTMNKAPTNPEGLRPLEYQSGNSQLLKDYRESLIEAYELGNYIKTVYGIVPPNVLFDRYGKAEFKGTVNLKLCVAKDVKFADQN